MLSYIIRRIGYAIIMVVLVSFVGFFILKLPSLVPGGGDFLTQKLASLRARGDRSAEQQIETYRVRFGLDKPFLVQYIGWAGNFIKGDFGLSFEYEKPVKDLIGERLTMTIVLAVATLIVTWVIAIPLGVYSAVRQYSLGDQIITTISFIGLGMPGFLLALLILFVAIVYLNAEVVGLFSQKYIDAPWSWAKFVDLMKHLWVPALISAVTGTGGLIRIMRGNLLDTLGQPFVEAAPRPRPQELAGDLETCRTHRHQPIDRHPGVRGISQHHHRLGAGLDRAEFANHRPVVCGCVEKAGHVHGRHLYHLFHHTAPGR